MRLTRREIKLLEGLAQNLAYGIKGIRTRTAGEAFADQVRKLSLIVEQSPESIVITNLNAEIEYVNEALFAIPAIHEKRRSVRIPGCCSPGKNTAGIVCRALGLTVAGPALGGDLLTGERMAPSMWSAPSSRPFAMPAARSRITWL